MPVTTRGDKPSALDAPLWGNASANITKPITTLINAGYATQTQPGSANWNWLTNYVSAGVTHCFIYGTPIWDTDEIYVADSYTNRNGIIFKSRVGANTGNIPESSPTQWQDTRSPLPIAISVAGTHIPQAEFNEVLNIDTTVGDFALTVNGAQFSDQFIRIIATGGNKVTLTIAGLSGTVILENQELLITWNGTEYFVSQDIVSNKIISASGAVVFGPVSYNQEIDTSGGSVVISALPAPDFLGQRIDFIVTGSGTGTITAGTGIAFDQVLTSAEGESVIAVDKSGTLEWEVIIDRKAICKAWGNFNGTGTPAVNDGFNIASIVRLGTGKWTVNLINPMKDLNFSAGVSGIQADSSTNVVTSELDTGRTVSSIDIITQTAGGTNSDNPNISVQIFGS